MKFITRLLSLLLVLCMIVGSLASCDIINGLLQGGETEGEQQDEHVHVDYAGQIKLDMTTPSAKTEVLDIHMHIDGDTTHFKVEGGIVDNVDNVLKARYIAINTPESTGKIEEWGNDAAAFTEAKLESADSIILESDTDDGNWNIDSTGERRIVWVWYRPAGETEYRNLNIEILQSGLAFASNTAKNRYGDIAMKAYQQARTEKLYIFSNDLDPDFPYGDPQPMLLRDIRLDIENHYYMNVYFEGNVVWDDGGTIYVEEYDPETDMYYGITAYYGTSALSGDGLRAIKVGNRVRLVGVITYFKGGDIWQVSDLYYDPFNLDDARCLELIEVGGHEAAYPLVDGATFLGNKTITIGGESKTYKYGELALNSSIRMEGLEVTRVYTTNNGGNNDGAMSLTCKTADGKTLTVRTAVLLDENGKVVTQDYFEGKTINVNGIVEEYNGSYQIKLFSMKNVEIVK